MRPPLLILLIVLGAVVVLRLTRTPAPTPPPPPPPNIDLRPLQEPPGEPPPQAPEFDVWFDVPDNAGGYPIVIHISERHGYYVQTFQLQIKKKDIDYRLELYYDVYLEADGILTCRENIVPAELPHFGGDMGTGADWEGIITNHGAYRAENPDPLPTLVSVSCGE